MDKLKLHSPNITEANIEKIAKLFPSCIVEAKDESGELTQKVDFDQLRQELSDAIVEGPQERYRLDWPGKREALLAANAPIAKTLRPNQGESVDFETTKNLFIEGDNLDALKLLQETYLGKVKMIYIDPPYNTGNDFIYNDDFSDNTQSYFVRSNQTGDSGERLVANTETNGRYHSDWLSMLYPRLKISRNLLCDNGVIFISINDIEIPNIRKICDDFFGEHNFLGQIIWHSKRGGGGGVKTIVSEHEYIVAYAKGNPEDAVGRQEVTAEELDQIDEIGPFRKSRELNKWGAGSARSDRPTMFFPISGPNGEDVYPIRNDGSEGRWRLGKVAMNAIISAGNALFEKRPDGTYIAYEKIRTKDVRYRSYRTIISDAGSASDGTARLKDLFNGKSPFDFPKPTQLLRKLFDIAAIDDGDIVLDFFAGSGTTADAVMQHSANSKNSIRFILVQLDEEAATSTYNKISDITKERIRRAGKKIKEDNATTADNLDIGFRVLKVDTSNAKDIYYTPDAISQDELELQVDHIKEDRTAEDLLFQVMLDWGVDLALPIASESIKGKTVYFVDENAIAACFDTKINEDFVKELAKREPLRVVFRDTCFESDSAKINVAEIFKLLSPNTDIKTL
jgi:adenine-specific DNA-methyltransferase